MTDQSQPVRPIELAQAIWKRRKWLAIPAFVLPFSAVAGMVPFLPDLYQASAVIVVDRQQVPEAFVRSTVTSGLENRIHTMSQEILSRSRLADLITRFDLYPELRDGGPAEAVVGRMRQDITVEFRGVESRASSRDGALVAFRVNYAARNPVTAARVANALASFYPEENNRVREQATADTTEFMRGELKEVKTRLEEQERRLTEFKSRHLGETPEQKQASLAIIDRITTQLRINRDNQTRAVERRETVAQQLVAAETAQVGPEAEPTAVRLMKMKQDLANLRTMFSDKYPDVIQLKLRIAALEQTLAEPAPRTAAVDGQASNQSVVATPQVLQLRRALDAVDAEIKNLKLEERRLRDDAEKYERRLENTPHIEQEFRQVSRDYETTSDLYKTLLKRYEEAQLAEALEQRQKGEQFRILENATPSQPAAPRRARLFLVGLAFSCGVAGAAVLLAEHLDTSFHRGDDLRAIAPVPVYSVPRIVTEADVRRWRWRLGVSAVATVVGVVLIFGASYLTASGRVPVVSELAYSLLVKA